MLRQLVFSKKLQQQSLIVACGILAAALLWTLVYAFWQWHSDWVLTHSELSAPTLTDSNVRAELIASIPHAHLFGQALTDSSAMPITNLQLRVNGIVKVNNSQVAEVSKAYISMAGEPDKIYQVGDSLPYEVKIYGITANAVILEHAGRLEKLPLARTPLIFKSIEKVIP